MVGEGSEDRNGILPAATDKSNPKPKALSDDTDTIQNTTGSILRSSLSPTNAGTTATTTTTTTAARSIHVSHDIEDKIGFCLEEFRCQHNNFTGILYVGPLGMVFLGRFLLFEWTVILKWEDVTKVRRKVSTPTAFYNNPNNVAIRIETVAISSTTTAPSASNTSGGGRFYDFEGFFDSQTTLETLIKLHNDSLLDNDEYHMSQIITKRGSVIPLRRSRSNPAEQISNIFNFDDEVITMTEHQINNAIANDASANASSNYNSNANANTNANQTTILDLRNQYTATNKAALQSIASASSLVSIDAPSGGTNSNTNTPRKNSKPCPAPDQLTEEWAKVCNSIDNDYPEAPVSDRQIVISMDDLNSFVESFVSDNAPFSWSRFMAEITGDTDVIATKWIESEHNSSNSKSSSDKETNTTIPTIQCLTRTIDYTHPVNAPMAPPTARARKEQTLTKYGPQNGLVVETKTIVSDLPMTDCFYVKDVLQIKRVVSNDNDNDNNNSNDNNINSSNNKSKWVVNIRFEVVFVKSTMFRALISRTTTSEFRTFMSDLASWFCKHCGSNNGMVDPPVQDPEQEIRPNNNNALEKVHSSNSSTTTNTINNNNTINGNLDLAWKALVIGLLLWMTRMQCHLSNEHEYLKETTNELKSMLEDLEAKQSMEARFVREKWQEWKSTLTKLEQT